MEVPIPTRVLLPPLTKIALVKGPVEVANLESAMSVLSSVSQPKMPPEYVRKEPDWQVARLKPVIAVPERLVVDAVVAKKLVVVA